MRKLPYQSSLQFIQRPQLLWNDIGDRKLWRGIQWIRRGPTVPSRLSWNAYIKVTYQNPGVEYAENMVCEDFLNMGMLPLEIHPILRWSEEIQKHHVGAQEREKFEVCFIILSVVKSIYFWNRLMFLISSHSQVRQQSAMNCQFAMNILQIIAYDCKYHIAWYNYNFYVE